MLTLAEKLLLIALDDQTGKMNMNASQSIHYGLAGAILMELTTQRCLDYNEKDKTIHIPQNANCRDELLNDSLLYLKDKYHGKTPKLQRVVQTLGFHINWHKKHIPFIERLIEKEILTKNKQKVLFLFTRNVYPSTQSGREDSIREKIRKAVLSNEDQEVEEQIFSLIGLLKACQIDKQLFSKDEYKQAKEKINMLMKKSPHGKAVSDTMQAMQAAVMAATTAAVVTASSSASS
ncbi:GPP34 family phosphoprotein [Halalkalibacter sp. APA_J-10(15)]|uniref:GOLPH3/VPS74 family protein n=1 Tax=Halalkalibacter sp. APA_J-10(15) TaxID=2933805 RepID=UPI001FF2AD99|nr:GPP34 family phosphoprotein [Halalkalibacter sp. APA_J-10(15)]MCK0473599.1 GPP34 family phosphoprotein [Halalkalibacter sp. APA_J-10(15)]